MNIKLSAVLCTVLIAGCGGGGSDSGGQPRQIVSFGDSLSDVGTYEVVGSPPVGPRVFDGGRFTSNPGAVWTEQVARSYGDRLLPAVQGGFGAPPVDTGGMGYAQGGAQVNTALAENYPGDYSRSLAWSLSRQVDNYLFTHHYFRPDQIVLLQGGGNDIINAVLVGAVGFIAPADVPRIVTAAASDLAAVAERIARAGGRNMALLNVPDIGRTPFAAQNPDIADALGRMTRLFNETLQSELSGRSQPQNFVFVDAYGWYADTQARFRENGFKVANADVACSLPKVLGRAAAVGLVRPDRFVQENGWALLCSASTLVEPDADQTYMFADPLHPATRMQALFARHVVDRLGARGL